MTRYERGWRDAIEAAAKFLESANVSPEDAKGHWGNAGGALRHMLERGELAPLQPEPKRAPGLSETSPPGTYPHGEDRSL